MDRTDPSFRIRPATVADVPALAAVHLEAWLATYRGTMADAYLDSLNQTTFEGYHRPRFNADGQTDPMQPFVVACDAAGQVIGFARGGAMRGQSPTGDPLPPEIVRQFSSELFAIYLSPGHVGRGVGRAMFRTIVRQLIDLGHRSMCVWVLDQNPLGRRFYERMGGRLIGCESHVTLGGIAYPHVAYGWEDLRPVVH